MIISHQLKLIYIKLSKVGGTSFEIALSKYCGPDDILAPIHRKKDERLRKSLGFYGAQNCEHLNKLKPKLYDHASAEIIQQKIAKDVWDNYLKIASIRCLYDAFISHYYFSKHITKNKERVKDFEHFVVNTKKIIRELYKLHDENGKLLTDFLIRYEHLDEDIKELEIKINCPGLLETFQSINAKGEMRPKTRTSSCEMYSKYPNAKLIIDQRCLKNAHKYEYFREYWPLYKAELEKNIENYSSNTG